MAEHGWVGCESSDGPADVLDGLGLRLLAFAQAGHSLGPHPPGGERDHGHLFVSQFLGQSLRHPADGVLGKVIEEVAQVTPAMVNVVSTTRPSSASTIIGSANREVRRWARSPAVNIPSQRSMDCCHKGIENHA